MRPPHLLTYFYYLLIAGLLLTPVARAEIAIGSLTVADQLTEFIQRYRNDWGGYDEMRWHKQTTALQTTLKLTGDSVLDLQSMHPFTNVHIQAGSMFFSGRLGSDPSFTYDNMATKRSVFIRTHADPFTGEPAGTSGVRLSWTATQVTISLTASNMDMSPMGSPLAESLMVQDAPVSPVRKVNASVPLSIRFDSINLTQKKVFMQGTVEVKAQKVSGNTHNFHHIKLTGAADTTRPTITVNVPNRGLATLGQEVKLTGKVVDSHGIRRIGIIHKHVSQELTNGVTTVKGPPEGAPATWWGPSEKTFEVMVSPDEGANDVIVWAEDIDGNRTEKTVRVTVPVSASFVGRWDTPVGGSEEDGYLGYFTLQVTPQGTVTGSLRMVRMAAPKSFVGVWQGGRVDAWADKGKSGELRLFALLADLADTSVSTARLRISLMKNDSEFLTGTAVRIPYSATNKIPADSPWLGRFHTLLPGNPSAYAIGASHFAMVTAPTGVNTVSGRLCDGTTVTSSAVINAAGVSYALALLYGNKGGVLLEATLPEMIGVATLYRPAGLPDRQFPNGILTSIGALLHRYAPPARNQRILGLSTANARAEWHGDGVEVAAIVQPALVSLANKISPDGTSPGFTASFAPATGLITGSFKLPTTPAATASFSALVVGDEAVGHYIAPAPAGVPEKRYGHFLLKAPATPATAP